MDNIAQANRTSAEIMKEMFDNPKTSEWVKKAIKELLNQNLEQVNIDLVKLTKLFRMRSMEQYKTAKTSYSWGRIK